MNELPPPTPAPAPRTPTPGSTAVAKPSGQGRWIALGVAGAVALFGVVAVALPDKQRETETISTSTTEADKPIRVVLTRPIATYRLRIDEHNGKAPFLIDVEAKAGLTHRVMELKDIFGPAVNGTAEIVTVYQSVFLKSESFPGQPEAHAGKWVKMTIEQARAHPVASVFDPDFLVRLGRSGPGFSPLGEKIAGTVEPTNREVGTSIGERFLVRADKRGKLDGLAPTGDWSTITLVHGATEKGLLTKEEILIDDQPFVTYQAADINGPVFVLTPPKSEIVPFA